MRRLGLAAFSFGLAFAGGALASTGDDLLFDPTQLSFDELINTTITSVSKKAERLQDAAAAVFVLNRDDIRRAHVRTIPDALRLVPGVQVNQGDSGSYTVSARGFGGNIISANKLLVLIDGRSVYNPLFGGVIWEAQSVVLEDIERIEVIRGPGGTLWGNNAVNGVINIITQNARDTQGGLLVAGTGTEEQAIATLRYGGKLGDNGHYRVYLRHHERGESYRDPGNASDDFRNNQGGFRADWETSEATHTLQGDYYDNAHGFNATGANTHYYGGNLLYSISRDLDAQRSYTFQTYWDYTELEQAGFDESRDTLDFDFQYRYDMDGRHDLVWGLNYRHVGDNVVGFGIVPVEREDTTISAFIQDEMQVTEKLTLIAGTKLEENDYSGGEVQPSLRYSYSLDEQSTTWGAVSRAVRVPTRLEGDIPGLGDKTLGAEVLIAYEMGYRTQANKDFSYDLTAYLHDYDELIQLVVPFDNNGQGKTWGLEFSSKWRPREWWIIDTTFTWLQQRIEAKSGKGNAVEISADTLNNSDPAHRATVFSRMDLDESTEFDVILRYADNIYGVGGIATVPSYLELDLGLTFRLNQDLSLEIAGRNLLDSAHPEVLASTAGATAGQRNEIQRSIHGTVTWKF